MKRVMMAVAAVALVSGCVTNCKNDGGDADLKPKIVRDIAYEKYDIATTPVSASEQVVGIVPVGQWNWFTVGGMSQHLADDVVHMGYPQASILRAKSGAYALACEKAGCDSLVGTRYEVTYKWFFFWNEATVTVTGYPAKLTGVEFRKAKFD